MAYKRKRRNVSRSRRPRKRVSRRYRSLRRRSTRNRLRISANRPELKQLIHSSNQDPIPSVGQVVNEGLVPTLEDGGHYAYITPEPPQGTAHNRRIGRKITVKRMHLQMLFEPQNNMQFNNMVLIEVYRIPTMATSTPSTFSTQRYPYRPSPASLAGHLFEPNQFLVTSSGSGLRIYDPTSLREPNSFRSYKRIFKKRLYFKTYSPRDQFVDSGAAEPSGGDTTVAAAAWSRPPNRTFRSTLKMNMPVWFGDGGDSAEQPYINNLLLVVRATAGNKGSTLYTETQLAGLNNVYMINSGLNFHYNIKYQFTDT